jgi:hypothetical protein
MDGDSQLQINPQPAKFVVRGQDICLRPQQNPRYGCDTIARLDFS